MKEANGNLKKVRLPPTKEELAEQEAELAAWEARKREVLQSLSGEGSSLSGHQQVNGGAAQGQSPQQASAGAPGTGTSGEQQQQPQSVLSLFHPSDWWLFLGAALMTLALAYVTYVVYTP